MYMSVDRASSTRVGRSWLEAARWPYERDGLLGSSTVLTSFWSSFHTVEITQWS